MTRSSVTLMSNGTGTGTPQIWMGGKCIFLVEGSFSTQTVKIQLKSPNGTFLDVPNSSLSANGMVSLELPAGQVQVVATATAVFAYLISTQY